MGVVVIGGGGSGGGGNQNGLMAQEDGRVMQGEEVVAYFDNPDDGIAYADALNAERQAHARFIPNASGLTPESLIAADDPRA